MEWLFLLLPEGTVTKSSARAAFLTGTLSCLCPLFCERFPYSLFNFFSTFIYFWDRERQSMNGGGSEREGDTESETGSRLRAISPEPDAGLELPDREIVTWLK